MEPTNDRAERALRPVVIARKVRQHLMSTEGMRQLGILMTCILTWRASGIGISERLQALART